MAKYSKQEQNTIIKIYGCVSRHIESLVDEGVSFDVACSPAKSTASHVHNIPLTKVNEYCKFIASLQ